MNSLYDILAKSITETEYIMFGRNCCFNLRCVKPAYVDGFTSDLPYMNMGDLKYVGIYKEQLRIIDRFVDIKNTFSVQMFHGGIHDLDNQFNIRPFIEVNNSDRSFLSSIISDNATTDGRAIKIVPYTKDEIAHSYKLTEAIVMINHIIQIVMAYCKVGVQIPTLYKTALRVIYPNSNYVAEYKSTETGREIIISSGDMILYIITMNITSPLNLGVSTPMPKVLNEVIRLHRLQVSEVNNAGLFIYLISEILNSILSKQTIYKE